MRGAHLSRPLPGGRDHRPRGEIDQSTFQYALDDPTLVPDTALEHGASGRVYRRQRDLGQQRRVGSGAVATMTMSVGVSFARMPLEEVSAKVEQIKALGWREREDSLGDPWAVSFVKDFPEEDLGASRGSCRDGRVLARRQGDARAEGVRPPVRELGAARVWSRQPTRRIQVPVARAETFSRRYAR